MEEAKTIVEQTPVMPFVEEVFSEDNADLPPASAESADPSDSGLESTTEAENSHSQLHLFVSVLTLRVLRKCKALQNHSQEEWVAHSKRLINQTMEGLTLINGHCPDIKMTKKMCKAVMKELQKKMGSQQELGIVVLLQDPAVDKVIVQLLQAHIKESSVRLAEKADNLHQFWKDMLQVAAFTAGLLACLVLILFVA